MKYWRFTEEALHNYLFSNDLFSENRSPIKDGLINITMELGDDKGGETIKAWFVQAPISMVCEARFEKLVFSDESDQ